MHICQYHKIQAHGAGCPVPCTDCQNHLTAWLWAQPGEGDAAREAPQDPRSFHVIHVTAEMAPMAKVLPLAPLHLLSWTQLPQPGSDRASRNLGAAHCEHTVSREPAPAAYLKVLQMCRNARGQPLAVFQQAGAKGSAPGGSQGAVKP